MYQLILQKRYCATLYVVVLPSKLGAGTEVLVEIVTPVCMLQCSDWDNSKQTHALRIWILLQIKLIQLQ